MTQVLHVLLIACQIRREGGWKWPFYTNKPSTASHRLSIDYSNLKSLPSNLACNQQYIQYFFFSLCRVTRYCFVSLSLFLFVLFVGCVCGYVYVYVSCVCNIKFSVHLCHRGRKFPYLRINLQLRLTHPFLIPRSKERTKQFHDLPEILHQLLILFHSIRSNPPHHQ